jgi:hypothetical protein
MNIKSLIYTALKISNDINSVSQSYRRRSPRPILNRIGRRAYGKGTGRLASKIFKN